MQGVINSMHACTIVKIYALVVNCSSSLFTARLVKGGIFGHNMVIVRVCQKTQKKLNGELANNRSAL